MLVQKKFSTSTATQLCYDNDNGYKLIAVSHGHFWLPSSLIQIEILNRDWLSPAACVKEPIATEKFNPDQTII